MIHSDWNSHVSDGSLKWYNCFGMLIDLIKANYMYINDSAFLPESEMSIYIHQNIEEYL